MQPSRPPLLTALCLLSFAGSGAGFLLYLAAAVFHRQALDFIVTYSSTFFTEKLTSGYFLVFSLANAISFAGVARIWKLKKYGLVLYIVSQLFILALPLIWLGRNAFSMVALVFTVVFIAGYLTVFTRHYKVSE